MSHTSREKLDLVNRTKKVIGQLEATLRALNDDEQCADVLQRLAAARGAINSLMGELMEDHIRNNMSRNSKSSNEAADDLIGIVRRYLKRALAVRRSEDRRYVTANKLRSPPRKIGRGADSASRKAFGPQTTSFRKRAVHR